MQYLDNEKFHNELIIYQKSLKKAKKEKLPKPKIPDYIGECFFAIATHLAYRPNFKDYTYKDEMISDGVENCLMYFHNFNPKLVSKRTGKAVTPFNYFTQIIYYAFLRRIEKEKKQQYIKYKSMDQTIDPFALEQDDENKGLNRPANYDNINIYIRDFEDKLENKKKRKK